MPSRVNGIGTTYLGKRNLKTFRGVCEACRAERQLQDYETTLWFTVLYLPLIPLSKKQVLNFCSVCTRHHAMGVDEWARHQEQTLQRGMDEFANSPDDGKKGLQLLGMLAAFHKQSQAASLAEALAAKFPRDAEVLLQLGAYHEDAGRGREADAMFERALAVSPQHAGARRAVAIGCIERGELARARQILESSPALSMQEVPGAYFALAKAMEASGQRDAALELYQKLMAGNPELARDKTFRAAVGRAEKNATRPSSMLPVIPWYQRAGAWWAAAALVFLAAWLGANLLIGQSRTVHVVNGFSGPMTIKIDGGSEISVGPLGRKTVKLAEGSHRVEGKVQELVLPAEEFSLHTNFFSRLFWWPVMVLNPGRGAVVFREETTYSEHPVRTGNSREDYYNQLALQLNGIDYVFEDFPPSIQVEKKTGSVTKRRCAVEFSPPEVRLQSFPENIPGDEVLSFAERHLRVSHGQEKLHEAYLNAAARLHQVPRAKEFLATDLDRRPLRAVWHRWYQAAASLDHSDADLPAYYEKLLSEDEGNPATHYLLARVQLSCEMAITHCNRALDLNPKYPDALRCKSYRYLVQGKLGEARRFAEAALRLDDKDEDSKELMQDVNYAQRDYAAVDRAIPEFLVTSPDVKVYFQRMALYSAMGDLKRLEAMHNSLEDFLRKNNTPPAGVAELHVLADGFKGDHASLERQAPNSPTAKTLWLWGNAARGEMAGSDEIFEASNDEGEAGRGYLQLCGAIGHALAGDRAQQTRWMEKGIATLGKGSRQDRQCAEFLARPAAVRTADLTDLYHTPPAKAIVIVALAAADSPAARELLPLADRLNYTAAPRGPYRLLQNAIRQLGGAAGK